MKLFDVNTAVGHWPFRRLENNTLDGLHRLLSSHDIAGAAVANTNGLFYKNCHDANLELAEGMPDHADFFVGVATLNPTYAAWERDIEACARTLGFRGLRLTPQYHAYSLRAPEARAIAQAAAALGLIVFIPHRVVDPRQRHWFDTEKTVDPADVVSLCEAVPDLTVIVTESPFTPNQLHGRAGDIPDNLLLECSRLRMESFPADVAAERVVFGSGAPFKHISPAKLRLQTADLPDAARKAVAGDTARTLMGLDPA